MLPSIIGDLTFQLSLDAIVVMNSEGEVSGWNPAAEALFGWPASEAIGRKVLDLIVPEQYRSQHLAGLQRFRETGEGPVLGKVLDFLTAVKRDGSEFPIEIRISRASDDAAGASFVAFLRDISERKWAERYQQARYAVTRAIAGHSSWSDVIKLVLEAACDQLGFVAGEVWLVDEESRTLCLDNSWCQAGSPANTFFSVGRAVHIQQGQGLLGRTWEQKNGTRGPLEGEIEERQREATRCGLGSGWAVPILGGDSVLGVVALYRAASESDVDAVALEILADIGSQLGQYLERMQIEEALRVAQRRMRTELEHRANTDRLTGLLNRAGFDEAVKTSIAHGRREGDQFALLMLDLDGFKAVNDTHGHAAGDRLLRMVGERLKAVLRTTDTLARLGGDEFAILSSTANDVGAARQLANRVIGVFGETLVEGVDVTIGTSVGIALFPAHGTDPSSLLHNADAAMYFAKRTKSGQAMYREGLPSGRGG